MLDEVLKLPETLDTAGGIALRDELLGRRGTATRLDASAVAKINGFGVEILVAAQRLWAEDNAEFAVSAPSDTFSTTVADLGLSAILCASETRSTDGERA